MSERKPVPWTPLTAEQWKTAPRADHTTLFSRDEVLAALRLLMPADQAISLADELYSKDRAPGVFFFGELLSALSTLSDSAAERVRTIVPSPPKPSDPAT